jgi:hypothetical protein
MRFTSRGSRPLGSMGDWVLFQFEGGERVKLTNFSDNTTP